MISSIATQSMASSQNELQNAMGFKLMKNAMNDAEAQALTLLNDMIESTPAPAPAQHGFDVYA